MSSIVVSLWILLKLSSCLYLLQWSIIGHKWFWSWLLVVAVEIYEPKWCWVNCQLLICLLQKIFFKVENMHLNSIGWCFCWNSFICLDHSIQWFTKHSRIEFQRLKMHEPVLWKQKQHVYKITSVECQGGIWAYILCLIELVGIEFDWFLAITVFADSSSVCYEGLLAMTDGRFILDKCISDQLT